MQYLMKAVSCSEAHMGDVWVTCSTYMADAAKPASALLPWILAASHQCCMRGHRSQLCAHKHLPKLVHVR